MTTQTLERQEILQLIDELPNSAMGSLGEFVAFLRYREHLPNAGTIEAMEELRDGKGKKFSSIEALMADLHDENDD